MRWDTGITAAEGRFGKILPVLPPLQLCACPCPRLSWFSLWHRSLCPKIPVSLCPQCFISHPGQGRGCGGVLLKKFPAKGGGFSFPRVRLYLGLVTELGFQMSAGLDFC